jgi:hypothetical protein
MNNEQRTTSMNHTPGPWLVDFESDEFDSKQSRLRIIDGSESSICHPQGPLVLADLNVCAFAPHMDEPLANARLMAAAPALLRALEGILMIRPDYHAGRDDLWLNRGEVERIAREAIALVNGGAK